jgi:DNA-binding Lrp family transcriptional regulator
MTRVANEAIADVTHGRGACFGKREPSGIGRLGATVCVDQGAFALAGKQQAQSGGRPTEAADDADDVTRSRAGAQHRATSFDYAECRARQHELRGTHQVSSNQLGPGRRALVAHTGRDRIKICQWKLPWSAKPEQENGRPGAHSGDISKILCGGFASYVVSTRPVTAKMGALDQQIGRRHQATRGYGDQGRIVTWPFWRYGHADRRCQPRDQIEFSDVLNFGHTALWRWVAFERETLARRPFMQGVPVVHAYILIQTEVGKAASVAAAIAKLDGVTEAEGVTGPYDVIVRCQATNVDELGKLVVAKVQLVEGITRTVSCTVVHL